MTGKVSTQSIIVGEVQALHAGLKMGVKRCSSTGAPLFRVIYFFWTCLRRVLDTFAFSQNERILQLFVEKDQCALL